MQQLSASAPAKLIFLGEYAVLEGAPALVAAIDCRARVTLLKNSEPNWRLSAPELGIRELGLGPDGQLPETLDNVTRESLALFDAVRLTVAEHAPKPPPLSIHIDTAQFYDNGRKLGLGSSAAVAVALTTALAAATGEMPERETLFTLASAAHRWAQGGIGSNTDIAAAVYGGVLGYRSGQAPVAVTLPPNLWLQPVLLNRSASTPSLVAQVLRLKKDSPTQFKAVMKPLLEAAEQGYSAFKTQNEETFLHTLSYYQVLLRRLGEATGADIISAPHRGLQSAARLAGLYYKSCGAGGGDVGLMAAAWKDQNHEDLARRIALSQGHSLLEASLGATGVAIEYAR